MTSLILYLILPASLALSGGAALIRRNHAGDPDARLRCAKIAYAFFGSAAIIWIVYILGTLLQFVVIVIAIGYYLKWLLWGRPSFWILRVFRIRKFS